MIVPVCLNLLPKDATAHILAPETNGHRQKTGLVRINIHQSKFIVHALFHLEDVYSSVGKQLVQEIIVALINKSESVRVTMEMKSILPELHSVWIFVSC